jgi:very-long-chain enoyl-CoA reductase
MKITVQFKSREKDFMVESESQLSLLLEKEFKVAPLRQRLVTQNRKKLDFASLTPSSTIVLKDLGPQIAWKTVFLIEYFGPIVIHLLFFYFGARHSIQVLSMLLNVIHYSKRELETLFVHRFSNATMPLTNLPKNCFHYWILGGLVVGIGFINDWSWCVFDGLFWC